MQLFLVRLGEPLRQVPFAIAVHEEPDGAAIHAEDRHGARRESVQRLQHEAVAAERHDDVGLLGILFAIGPLQAAQRRLRLIGGSRDEREALGLPGTFSHE